MNPASVSQSVTGLTITSSLMGALASLERRIVDCKTNACSKSDWEVADGSSSHNFMPVYPWRKVCSRSKAFFCRLMSVPFHFIQGKWLEELEWIWFWASYSMNNPGASLWVPQWHYSKAKAKFKVRRKFSSTTNHHFTLDGSGRVLRTFGDSFLAGCFCNLLSFSLCSVFN